MFVDVDENLIDWCRRRVLWEDGNKSTPSKHRKEEVTSGTFMAQHTDKK